MTIKQTAITVAFTTLILDQITKIFVLTYIATTRIELLPFFNLVLVWNKGVSFGMFQQGSAYGAYLLSGFSLLIVAFFIYWLSKIKDLYLAIAMGMVIGGAIGNVIDRIRFRAVVDFLDFHLYGWHYPTFNIADSCIVLGILYIVLDGLFRKEEKKEDK